MFNWWFDCVWIIIEKLKFKTDILHRSNSHTWSAWTAILVVRASRTHCISISPFCRSVIFCVVLFLCFFIMIIIFFVVLLGVDGFSNWNDVVECVAGNFHWMMTGWYCKHTDTLWNYTRVLWVLCCAVRGVCLIVVLILLSVSVFWVSSSEDDFLFSSFNYI